MVTYIIGAYLSLVIIIFCLYFVILRKLERQEKIVERIDELQERFLQFEKYVCGQDGHFEDSVRNGSSLNSIINATLLEVAKLNPNDWTVTDTNKDKLQIVEHSESKYVEYPQVERPVADSKAASIATAERDATIDDDGYARIEYADDDFTIEEE